MARGSWHRSRSRLGMEGRRRGSEESDSRHAKMELELLLEEHTEGMVVQTGITFRHGQYPRLGCCWSGVDAGRRFLQCADVLNPCDFKHWIDAEFSGRAKRVIQDLVAMNGSV